MKDRTFFRIATWAIVFVCALLWAAGSLVILSASGCASASGPTLPKPIPVELQTGK